jgi:threonine synthase
VLRKLVEDGRIGPDETTVALNTGDGLKTLDAVSPTTGLTAVIKPSLAAFHDAGLA